MRFVSARIAIEQAKSFDALKPKSIRPNPARLTSMYSVDRLLKRVCGGLPETRTLRTLCESFMVSCRDAWLSPAMHRQAKEACKTGHDWDILLASFIHYTDIQSTTSLESPAHALLCIRRWKQSLKMHTLAPRHMWHLRKYTHTHGYRHGLCSVLVTHHGLPRVAISCHELLHRVLSKIALPCWAGSTHERFELCT
eukprot:s2163_g5.t1